MPLWTRETRDACLQVRLRPSERDLLHAAARRTRRTVSELVRDSVLAAALEILEPRMTANGGRS